MSIMKHPRSEVELPDWFPTRLFDWPETWRELIEESHLRVEEFEEDGHLVVRAEMPGLDPDKDVEITVEEQTLRIKAERRQESRTESKKGYRSEFRYGSFTRTVVLPAGASASEVSATYTDGILEVRIPINLEQASAKRVPISHS